MPDVRAGLDPATLWRYALPTKKAGARSSEASVMTWATPALFPRINHATRFEMASFVSLLRRYTVELPGPLLIKERAFGLVAAAPVFVATWDEEELARPNTLFAGFVLI